MSARSDLPIRGDARILVCILVLAMAAWSTAAVANVPHEAAVPAYSTEQTLLQIEQDVPEPGWFSSASGRVHTSRNFISSTIDEPEVMVQRGGNTWRALRNGPLAFWSAVILILVPLGIAAFYVFVGPQKLHGDARAPMPRFSAWERWVHWSTAIVFVLLAITGVSFLYGKVLLIPLLGHDLYADLAIILKWVHNLAGPVFFLLTLLMFATFLRGNAFNRGDWAWIRAGGGLIGGRHVPAGKFNAGEKLWFWLAVTGLGLAVSVSGLVLDFVNFGQTRYVLQIANYVHLATAVIYMAGALGHIYIGTLGSEGSYQGMRYGSVEERWAKQHHEYWYHEMKRGADERSRPGATP